MIAGEIALNHLPKDISPNRICNNPTRNIIKNNFSTPIVWIISTIINIKPAAGPETCRELPENKPTTIPPIIPDTIPLYIGKPQAIEIPIARGRATKKTIIDAIKSFFTILIIIKIPCIR